MRVSTEADRTFSGCNISKDFRCISFASCRTTRVPVRILRTQVSVCGFPGRPAREGLPLDVEDKEVISVGIARLMNPVHHGLHGAIVKTHVWGHNIALD